MPSSFIGNERSLISQSCCWWGYFITAAAATQSFRQEKGELEQSPPFFSTQWSEFALYRKALESIAWEGWIKANCLFSKESTCGWVWYLVNCSKCYTTNRSLHETHLHRGKLSRFELKNTCVDTTQGGNLYATTDSRKCFILRIECSQEMSKAMSRCFHLSSLLIMCSSCAVITLLHSSYEAPVPGLDEKPNIVFILADDLGEQMGLKNPRKDRSRVHKSEKCRIQWRPLEQQASRGSTSGKFGQEGHSSGKAHP